jgi:hypothetical protein
VPADVFTSTLGPATPGSDYLSVDRGSRSTRQAALDTYVSTPPVRGSGYLGTDETAFARGAQPDYFDWLNHVWAAAGCTHPIRLVGEIATVERETGRLLSMVSTQDMPDGQIYKACGNRRASVCPSCSQTYQGDAFQLIRAGLVGGKGVPNSVATHPAAFVTLTAPGFGTVHTRRTSKTGQALPCRPRRHLEPCSHGVDMRCHRIHADGEHSLGVPLCLDCYDHDAQVVWNRTAGELWRRTSIAIRRHVERSAAALGVPAECVRVSYAKVAEMQRRGVVHFHIVIRLDGHHPDLPELVLPPPPGLGVEHLDHAVKAAAATVAFTTDPHPANPAGWPICWGTQVDVRPIRLRGDGQMSDGMAAGYLAKYATKATEATGHVSRRLDADTIDQHANPDGTHPERLIDACWRLGVAKEWRGLRRWAHMLGFGGHFLTKARRYSVTFKLLRDRRIVWRRTEGREIAEQHDDETILLITTLTYAGAGWRTTGDAMLANTAAALARERARIGREEAAALDTYVSTIAQYI